MPRRGARAVKGVMGPETALACEAEGFPWVGIERDAEYVAIAEARLHGTQRGLGLAVG